MLGVVVFLRTLVDKPYCGGLLCLIQAATLGIR